MIIISTMLAVMIMGYLLLYLTYIIPVLRLFYMDWIAMFVVSIPILMCIIRLGTSKSLRIFERKPTGKELTIFLRRDGTVTPMYMGRPFKGMSFLESKDIGLVHDLGKGSVYRWGDKNVRFILENVAHTPDPRFVGFTNWLYNIGFNNMTELRDMLKGVDNGGKAIVEKIVSYTPVDQLIDEIKNPDIVVSKNFVPDLKRMEKFIDGWKKK